MNATHMGQQRHECDTSENFDFDNDTSDDTSENIFSYPCIYYMVSERLKGVEQFHSKNYLFRNAFFQSQNAFEECITKTDFCFGKSYIKNL